MVAVLAALAVGWHLEKRLSPMPLFTAVLVVIFGGLTLYLKNEIFIKMKPTVLYAFFGVTLLGGLRFNRLFIKYVFAASLRPERERLARQLTWRWGMFFLAAGGAQRSGVASTSTATWVSFKVWGIMPLIFLFALAQTPFVLKHHVESGKRRQNPAASRPSTDIPIRNRCAHGAKHIQCIVFSLRHEPERYGCPQ